MSDPANPNPAPSPAPKPPETFSREYVHELREENKATRLALQEAKTAREAAEKAAKDAGDATKAAETAAKQRADERVIRAELKAVALKAGIVDLDGLKLADISALKLSDAGEVEGADVLIEALKKAKPYLFGEATTTSTGGKPAPKKDEAVDVRKMTDAEYKAHKAKLLKR